MEELAAAVFRQAAYDCQHPSKFPYSGPHASKMENRTTKGVRHWVENGRDINGAADPPRFKGMAVGPSEVKGWLESDSFEFWCAVADVDPGRARKWAYQNWL